MVDEFLQWEGVILPSAMTPVVIQALLPTELSSASFRSVYF
jgi:hypothetical protein